MRKLIAIVTCHAPKFRERAHAQRITWVQWASKCGFDVKFFLGNPPNNERPASDEVFLGCGDGYNDLPAKTRQVTRWAIEHGYDYLFKTDDDCYVNMVVLGRTMHEGYDYVGRFRGPSGGYPSDYASGYGYWLSKKAMQILAASPIGDDWAEDRWVANTLARHGINGHNDADYYRCCYPPVLPENVFSGPLRTAAVFCEYPPHLMKKMYDFHNHYRVPMPPARYKLQEVPLHSNNLAAVTDLMKPIEPPANVTVYAPKRTELTGLCVMIKTLMRDGYLFDCVRGLLTNFPECKLLIIDDGYHTADKDALYKHLNGKGHRCAYVPFDSGFGAKANYAIGYAKELNCPYMLVGSDDFDFSEEHVRSSVENLYKVITGVPELACASGRVDGQPYEAMLDFQDGVMREVPLQMGNWQAANGVNYKLCDLTINFGILRTSVLGWGPQQVHWDGGEVKIGGGEHGAFYMDLKEHGHKVAFVPGSEISTMRYNPAKEHPQYNEMRGRARSHPRTCIINRGVKVWVSRDGEEDVLS